MKELKSKIPLIIYEENAIKVINELKEGRVDYMDLSSWSFQDRFFAFLLGIRAFEILESSYPTPRSKEEIPVWFLIACQMQLKLHQEKSYSKLPGLLKNGPILMRVKFNIGGEEGGFNSKNIYPRTEPIHYDCMRKFFRDSDRNEINKWYNGPVIKFLRHNRAIDKKGIFLLDQTHLVVPDNEEYVGAEKALVDEHGQRIDTTEMTDEQKKGLKWRLCYTLNLLCHLGSDDGSQIICGYEMNGGNADELNSGMNLVRNFVNTAGKGMIKILIMDRGYINGEFIRELKVDHDIDVVVPVRKNMTILKDGIRIAENQRKKCWEKYDSYEKDKIQYCEEIQGIEEMQDWENCSIPLYIAVMRQSKSNGKIKYWGLATTIKPKKVSEIFEIYKKRSRIEELNKQLKESWKIHKFSSPHASLIETQVAFTLLTYNLIQLYLTKKHLIDLTQKTIESLKNEERMGINSVIVYREKNFGVLNLDYYTEIIAELKEIPKERLLKWIRETRKEWEQRDSEFTE